MESDEALVASHLSKMRQEKEKATKSATELARSVAEKFGESVALTFEEVNCDAVRLSVFGRYIASFCRTFPGIGYYDGQVWSQSVPWDDLAEVIAKAQIDRLVPFSVFGWRVGLPLEDE